MKISDRILELRRQKGISQEELADKLGVSRQAVSKWESEQSVPEMEKIIAMSEFFDVTTDYLLKGIEPIRRMTKKERPATFFLFWDRPWPGSAISLPALSGMNTRTRSRS